MTTKTTNAAKQLQTWQVEDAARLKSLFEQKKAAVADAGGKLTQASIAEQFEDELKSANYVWQLLSAHRPLNVRTAAAFAQALGIKIEDFSPTLGRQLGKLAQIREPNNVGHELPGSPRLQWVFDDEAELLNEYRACGADEKARALGIIRSFPKVRVSDIGIDRGNR